MGGISHLFDSKNTSKSRKSSPKKHGDGFEAPRNSLEMSREVAKGRRAIQEKVPYLYQMKQQASRINSYDDIAPMKKLIDDEVSKQSNEIRNPPNVVARLMGMNSFSEDMVPRVHVKEHEVRDLRNSISRNQPIGNGILRNLPIGNSISRNQPMEKVAFKNGTDVSLKQIPGKQTRENLLHKDQKRSSKSHRNKRPQPRKHPQEDLLQKLKKDFSEWQASKLLEHQILHKNYTHLEGNGFQTIAQESLNKEKMARYLDVKKTIAEQEPIAPKGVASSTKVDTLRRKEVAESNKFGTCRQQCAAASNKMDIDKSQGRESESYELVTEKPHITSKDDTAIKVGRESIDLEHLPATKNDKKHERFSSPTRIVILKPNMERCDGSQVSLGGTSDTSGKESSMGDFLQEVKERLQMEMYGKVRNHRKYGDRRNSTLFDDRSVDPKQIARDIAKQIRESVTKDIGATLMRSESTRSYMSEGQINDLDSPESIRRDTRKLISERLKNVLRKEALLDKAAIQLEKPEASSMVKEKVTSNFTSDTLSKDYNTSNWEDKKTVNDVTPNQSQESSVVSNTEVALPPILVRSFSAPVSGTAFGKLLLEDQQMFTVGQIFRRREGSDLTHEVIMRNRKDNITFKGRVSNLKHNLNLKGKLFKKKSHLIEESNASGFSPIKPIPSVPTAIIPQHHENATEVPPSPASVSGSSQDEYVKPENPSPISPLEVPVIEDRHPSPRAFGEISSTVSGMHLPEQIENAETEGAVEEKHSKHEEVESGDAAYLIDILETAGFYEDKSPSQTYSRWDALTRPISNQIFEEVEEAYSYDTAIEHKLLFDLVNEASQNVLTPKIKCSLFRKWALGSSAVPKGKDLLDELWNQIQSYVHPPAEVFYRVESIAAREARMITPSTLLYEDIDVVGKQIERVILRDLIEDCVKDICSH